MQLTQKKKIRSLAVLTIAIASLGGTVAFANFADDWASNMTTNSTNAGFYQGSQRGYFTGGSFSARWKQSNDNLVTISKPRIKSGCGGIDAFLGGFSFLDTDYLVNKLQRILSAAPAAAFDIALKTLAPQVSATIKELEAIVDKLNNLQLDDCKAAKALVATVGSYSPIKNNAYSAEIEDAQKDFMVSSGISDLSTQVQKTMKSEFKANTGTSPTSKAATEGALAGCPAKIKQMFAANSILEYLGTSKGLPSSHIATIRGLIGDVQIVPPTTTGSAYRGTYLPPCGKNDFDSLIDGTAQIREEGQTCQNSTDTKRNLNDYVTQRLITVSTAIKNRGSISSDDVSLIQGIPLPVLPALKAGIAAGTENMVIHNLSEVSAKGLAYNMLTDIVLRAREVNEYAKQLLSAQNTAEGASVETCQVSLLVEPIELLHNIEENARTLLKDGQESYGQSLAASQSIHSLVSQLEKFSNTAKAKLTSSFGSGASLRALGR